MARLMQRRDDGRVAAVAAAAWSVFDALVHVAVDQVEPPRIAGNVAAIVAAALVVLLDRLGGRARLSAVICGLAAGFVLGFNGAWVAAERELPVPAAVFIIVALVLLVWAATGSSSRPADPRRPRPVPTRRRGSPGPGWRSPACSSSLRR